MNVMFYAATTCPACGYQCRWIKSASVRVNKTSLRATSPSITAGPRRCQECGFPVQEDGPPLLWQLKPEDAVRVAETRRKRGWT